MSALGNWEIFLQSKYGARRGQEPSAIPPELAAKSFFRVMIVYEDFLNGQQAIEIYKMLLDHLGPNVQFDCHLWNFSGLRESRIFHSSIQEAAEADMILLSLHGDKPLPRETSEWLCSAAKSGSCQHRALVVLMNNLDEEQARKSHDYHFLQALAEKSVMDFFCHARKLPPSQDDESELWSHAPNVPLQDGIGRHQRPARWGLNE